MFVNKRIYMILIMGLIICLSAGGGYLYFKQKPFNVETTLIKNIPKLGLPNYQEFQNMAGETIFYWGTKIAHPLQETGSKIREEINQISSGFYAFRTSSSFFDTPKQKLERSQKISSPDQKLENDNSSEPSISPAPSAGLIESPAEYQYKIEDDKIQVEGVLVPQKTTIISSSRDGKIENIFVESGDLFQKGDILLSYDCAGLNADVSAMEMAEKLARQKREKGYELFKLEIISDLESRELELAEQKTIAENKNLKNEMESCVIRATYDGRVTNRLANPEEYTRTDRVLMEIASRDNLEVQFILPSKWLRFINVGAQINIMVSETQKTYAADVVKIFGEVDPVSQSIQMSARLKNYEDPLLPGMSGIVSVNAIEIRKSGIKGYLEQNRSYPLSQDAIKKPASEGHNG